MSYKEQRQISTGIHTRINDEWRISSAWRTFESDRFSTQAWETFLWNGEKIAEQFDTLKNADAVVNLHQEIVQRFKGGEFQ